MSLQQISQIFRIGVKQKLFLKLLTRIIVTFWEIGYRDVFSADGSLLSRVERMSVINLHMAKFSWTQPQISSHVEISILGKGCNFIMRLNTLGSKSRSVLYKTLLRDFDMAARYNIFAWFQSASHNHPDNSILSSTHFSFKHSLVNSITVSREKFRRVISSRFQNLYEFARL